MSTYYKLLGPSRVPLVSTDKTPWPRVRSWTPARTVEVCKSGWHLVTLAGIPEWVKIGELYEAEGRGEPQSDDGRKFCFTQARLIRKVGDLTAPVLVRWAADCAEHVLEIYESAYPNDDRPRKAIEAARNGDAAAADAAYAAAAYAAAANAAAYAAAAAAAYAATAYAAAYAAYAAAAAAAADAAYAAAYAAYAAAAYAAAADAAYAAYAAAAYAAAAYGGNERKWQGKRLIEILGKPAQEPSEVANHD